MFCLNVLPNVLPKCSADRCADGATTEGTVLAAAPQALTVAPTVLLLTPDP